MKNKRLNILIVVLITGLFIPVYASQNAPDSLFAAANRAYDKGLYDSAATTYRKIIAEGKESAVLYYNLGNAYYKNKDIPSAILYYEKAKKLAPNDEDIAYNLGIANTMIVDKIDKIPDLFYKRWWNSFYNLFDADSWAVFSILSFTILMLFIGMYILGNTRKTKRLAFYLGVVFLLISVVAFGLASQKYYYGRTHKEAIIFTPTLTVKSAPSTHAVDLFVIHDGTKVQVLDKVDHWLKIKIQNGSVGWLPADDLKEI